MSKIRGFVAVDFYGGADTPKYPHISHSVPNKWQALVEFRSLISEGS